MWWVWFCICSPDKKKTLSVAQETRHAMKVSKENLSDESYDVYQKYSQNCIYENRNLYTV